MISFARKWKALLIKITVQERIPVKSYPLVSGKNSDARMFLAPFLAVLVTQSSAICGIIHGLVFKIVTQSFHMARRILVTFSMFAKFAISSTLF